MVHPSDRAVRIPRGIWNLAAFRAWAQSDDFPDKGRIDWTEGHLEVDMTGEDLNTHGSPKSAIAIELGVLLQKTGRGMVFIDATRYSNEAADLSAEPDVLVILFETVEAGKARLVPRASGAEGRFCEIEGAVDLVVEVVSDTSEKKDLKRLPGAYHRAGVREFWLVDVRGDEIRFDVFQWATEGWDTAQVDEEGFRASAVLGRRVRLDRARRTAGFLVYRLDVE